MIMTNYPDKYDEFIFIYIKTYKQTSKIHKNHATHLNFSHHARSMSPSTPSPAMQLATHQGGKYSNSGLQRHNFHFQPVSGNTQRADDQRTLTHSHTLKHTHTHTHTAV